MRRADDLGRRCLDYIAGECDAITGFLLDEIEDLRLFISEAGLEDRYRQWFETGLKQRLLKGRKQWTSTGKRH